MLIQQRNGSRRPNSNRIHLFNWMRVCVMQMENYCCVEYIVVCIFQLLLTEWMKEKKNFGCRTFSRIMSTKVVTIWIYSIFFKWKLVNTDHVQMSPFHVKKKKLVKRESKNEKWKWMKTFWHNIHCAFSMYSVLGIFECQIKWGHQQ